MPVVSVEELSQALATSIEVVWEAEWARADLSLFLVSRYNKEQLKVIANHIGRSHQDLIRWASVARRFPPTLRRADRAPREHMRVIKDYEKTGKITPGWEYLVEAQSA